MTDFVHLHLHSEYSLLDGACRLGELVDTVKQLGQTSCAVTDHGNMFAAVEFYNACKAKGIKPIIGCEMYVAPRTRFDKVNRVDSSPYHLVLLCKDQQGYRNLIKLVSLSYTEGFYNKPRVDEQLLEKYSGGLVCLSACLAGEIPRKLLSGDYEGAKQTALRYNKIFGQGNYYLELQDHDIDDQKRIIPLLARISRETGIPLAATNDCHYLKREDAKAQRVLLCISTGTTLDDPNKLEFPTQEFYVKSGDEMSRLFANYPQAIENTVKIAQMCNVEFEFGNTKLPYFHIDGVEDNEKFLREMCRKGLEKRYKNPSQEACERLEYELDIITKMGYTDYYLIVWDFINYAKTHGIPVGCGRGSGAGSLCAYCIGITGIDPLRYNLLFERFLNPERVSMPDFDVDFCMEGRQRVIDYVINKYGEDHVAQIATFGTLAAKQAVRDVARVMGLSYQTGDMVSKAVPRGMPLSESVKRVPELSKMYNNDPKIKELIDTAVRVEGMPRNVSTHAAGVVITKDPVDCYVPVYARDGQVSTQYTMTILERLGLLKIDFLGLRNLTIINHCVQQVRKQIPDFDINNIPLDDKEVYEMLSRGRTEGVFQFESPGMTATITKLRPTGIEDLIAVISLYRPGPMDSIPTYIRNRHDPELVRYKHPLLKNILDVTYGCIVYQEQVMQIFRVLAGYSYGRADIVRRAMAKKKADVLEAERKAFVYGEKGQCVGAVANGVDEKTANEIFDEMSSFASYAFNKSHAAAYATISYQTAYLKCHFYKEYMAALMTNALLDSTEKLFGYITSVSRNGVKVLDIDINKSERGFVAQPEGIRFALLAVKSLGENAIAGIVSEREKNGEFRSLWDFCSRVSTKDINTRTVEALIKSGAFDCFGNNRREMLDFCGDMMTEAAHSRETNLEGQLDFFGMADQNGSPGFEMTIPHLEEFSRAQLLEYEHEALGMYLSGHPCDDYAAFARADKCVTTLEMISHHKQTDGADEAQPVKLVGMVISKKELKTRKGDMMCFVQLEDKFSSVELVVFPELFAAYSGLLQKGMIVYVSGKISGREDEDPKILAENIISAENFEKSCLHRDLCLRLNSADKEKQNEIKNIVSDFKGSANDSSLILYLSDIGRKIKLKDTPTVRMDKKLVEKLSHLLGEENVAFMQRK